MLCLLQLRVLLLSLWGGGVRRVYFYRILLVAPDSPFPIRLHPFESGVVYDGFRPDNRQDPAEMKKAIPSL